ncbi:MAG TPA: hypothetical protein VFJ24_11120 [Gaiellales bacterium]|nr:hypothetical protein [Gaiellales bacterium]
MKLAACVVVAATLLVAACSSGSSATGGAAGTCPTPAYRSPDPHRPKYALDLRVDPSAHVVSGTLRVVFTPDLATDRLVFRLWANGPVLHQEGARLAVHGITVAGAPRGSQEPDPTTLVVPGHFAAGVAVTAGLRFRLTLPQEAKDRISQHGDVIRLGSFFPILPWVAGRGWATDPPTRVPAETSTSPVADFDVHIAAPDGLGILASGERIGPGHWRANDVRDFAVATGDFRSAHVVAHAPRPVDVTVGVAPGVAADPAPLAALARHALEHLASLYGRYPWPTLSVAFGPDLHAEGIEYPTMIFEGPGAAHLIEPHEIAHQWFYSLVGNDQATDPWLDEGLASYAGAETSGDVRFFASAPMPPAARGRLGAPMTYWDKHVHAYFAGVYAQGVRAVNSIGPPERVACALRRYVARNAYGIADDADAVAAFASVFPDARRHFAAYGVR